MAFIGTNVNNLKRGAVFFACLAWMGCLGGVCRAAEPYVVAPVRGAQDLRLLPASAWPPPEAEQGEMLLKLSYLRGLLDALQYVQVAPKSSSQVLGELKGQDLHELAAAVDRYYLADPRRRELPPAAVLMRILPQRGGQPEITPLPR